jgi:2-amino-4-hydroxy-6-hydroxymethyldihydropteridine diphosphokinase
MAGTVDAPVPSPERPHRAAPHAGADGRPAAARRVFLGLGSNLGDRVRYLRDAVDTLRDVGLVAVSPVYETDPVGGPEQDRYLNLVAELRTERTPHELLGLCHRLETAAGRVREERWGPRTLDVDLLWIDGEAVDEPDLTVPHPRLWDRRFVVAPLHDLAPDVADDVAVDVAEGAVDWRGPLDEL